MCFPLYDMPTALLFSFLFHDLVMHLGRPRQMTALYPRHWGHMVATVLLTWRDHRNILLIIIQCDLYVIASCWKKMWISNRFSGPIQWCSPRESRDYCGRLSHWGEELGIRMSSCGVYHMNCIRIADENLCIYAYRNALFKKCRG